MSQALITPEVLAWAIARQHWTNATLARKLNIETSVVDSWVSGSDKPTYTQLKQIVLELKRPTAIFYLPNLPTEFPIPKLEDRRAPSRRLRSEPSPELREVLEDIHDRQQWAISYLREYGEVANIHVGGAKFTQAYQEVSQYIIDHFLTTENKGKGIQSFSEWRRSIEAQGIFIFQDSTVDRNECQGFAIAETYAPVIWLNQKDDAKVRLFSLIHELCHLLRSESAISGSPQTVEDESKYMSTERYCDRVAEEVLIPASIFKEYWERRSHIDFKEAARLAANYFQVSRFVILYRLLHLELVNKEIFPILYQALLDTPLKQDGAGGEYYVNKAAKYGVAYSVLVLNAASQGIISARDAGNRLDMKIENLNNYRRHIESIH